MSGIGANIAGWIGVRIVQQNGQHGLLEWSDHDPS